MCSKINSSLAFFATVFLSIIFSCATTPAEPPKKPNEFCYCGPLVDANGESNCAIWPERTRMDLPHVVISAKAQASCTPSDCSRLFSSKCAAMQMWVPPAKSADEKAAAVPQNAAVSAAAFTCYCDSMLIESNKGQATLVCAAWRSDQKQVLEYYTSRECKPDTCQKDPFQIAKEQCKQGFHSFYAPLSR